jgi:hypothetical protein
MNIFDKNMDGYKLFKVFYENIFVYIGLKDQLFSNKFYLFKLIKFLKYNFILIIPLFLIKKI